MKLFNFVKVTLFAVFFSAVQVSWAVCDQTLSPGANLVSAVTNAAPGATLCLNNGDYGSVDFAGVSKSNYVTLQSTSGRGATIAPNFQTRIF